MKERVGSSTETVNGVTYIGEWTLARGMLTVTVPGLGTETNQLGGLSPDWLARDLIRKIVRKR